MVKEPVAGRVKTRLGHDLGMVAAAWWFRHQTRRLLRDAQDRRWHLVLAVSPDRAVVSAVWPRHLSRRAQGRGDLGQRMARALKRVNGPAVLIGGDIPGVRRHHVAAAFAKLGGSASVIGPAEDGGFWLIGLRNGARQNPALFREVRWSTETALADTLPTLPKPTAFVATLQDVDTAQDLAALKAG